MSNLKGSEPSFYPAPLAKGEDFPDYWPGRPRQNAERFRDVWSWSIKGADDGGFFCVCREDPNLIGYFQPSAIAGALGDTDVRRRLDLDEKIDAAAHLLRITPPMRWQGVTTCWAADSLIIDDIEDELGTDET